MMEKRKKIQLFRKIDMNRCCFSATIQKSFLKTMRFPINSILSFGSYLYFMFPSCSYFEVTVIFGTI